MHCVYSGTPRKKKKKKRKRIGGTGLLCASESGSTLALPFAELVELAKLLSMVTISSSSSLPNGSAGRLRSASASAAPFVDGTASPALKMDRRHGKRVAISSP